jgi:thiaminase
MLAIEILSDNFSPAFARQFMIDMIEPSMPALADHLDIWKPASKQTPRRKDEYYEDWINFDLITGTALGAGFIALRDAKEIASEEIDERSFERVPEIFNKGVDYGLDVSIKNLNNDYKTLSRMLSRR